MRACLHQRNQSALQPGAKNAASRRPGTRFLAGLAVLVALGWWSAAHFERQPVMLADPIIAAFPVHAEPVTVHRADLIDEIVDVINDIIDELTGDDDDSDGSKP